jgi:anti-anti-sigma factor
LARPDRIAVLGEETGRLAVTAVHHGAHRASVYLCGELDLASAELLTAVLSNQLATGHRYLSLDLSRVGLLDTAGLDALRHAHHRFLDARGTLVLTHPGPRITRLLNLTGLDQTLLLADGPPEPDPATPPPRPALTPVG